MTKESIDVETLQASGGLETIRDGEPDDVFLTCGSYEPRTLAGVESLADDYRAEKGVIYVNSEFIEGLDGQRLNENLERLKRELRHHCEEVVVAEGSWLEMNVQLNAMKEHLTMDSKDELTATIDTTTFNREALLVALNLLQRRYASVDSRLLYTSPEEHGEWLSRGHRSIRNILGFAGIYHSNKPTVLVVLSGFETERTVKIIENFEPTKVLLGVSNPSTEAKFGDRVKRQQQLVLDRQDTERFEFPADDTGGCYELLNEQIEAHSPEWNVVLAPMSTKLSTIGVWRVAHEHPEVQVTYAIPGEYNTKNYSTGIGDMYIERLAIE